MKLLLSILTIITFCANAQDVKKHQNFGLTQETIDILASGKQKEKKLQAKRDEVKANIPHKLMAVLCSRATSSDIGVYTRTVNKIKAKIKNPVINPMTYAELAYFADCKGLNAIERNMDPGTIHTDKDGLSKQTLFLIKEMGQLLGEKGLTNQTLLDYAIKKYLSAASAMGAGTYQDLCRVIGSQLFELGHPLGERGAHCEYYIKIMKKNSQQSKSF